MKKKEMLKLNFDPSTVIKSNEFKNYVNNLAQNILIDKPTDDSNSNAIACSYIFSIESQSNILKPELLKLFKEFAPKFMQQIIFMCFKDGADNLYNRKYFDEKIRVINIEKEIKNIESLFSDNDLSSYPAIISTFNRGLALAYSQLTDRELLSQARVVYDNPERFDEMLNNVSDDEIFNVMVSPILNSNELVPASPIVREHIFHFKSGIPFKSFEYCCQSEPFFLALIEYKQYLEELLHSQEITVSVSKKTKIDKQPNLSSFTYKYQRENPSALSDLLRALINNKLVHESTDLWELKEIFSGKLKVKPIVWIGVQNKLYYFIKCILDNKTSVINIQRNRWIVTCNCFIKYDGTKFDPTLLRTSDKPETDAEIIERIASLLK